MRTPWGKADLVTEIATGITAVSTPSHGGIHLSPERNAQVPQHYREFAAKWSKGWYDGSANKVGWYEEDCAAIAVILTFPEEFPERYRDPEEQDRLRDVLAHYME